MEKVPHAEWINRVYLNEKVGHQTASRHLQLFLAQLPRLQA